LVGIQKLYIDRAGWRSGNAIELYSRGAPFESPPRQVILIELVVFLGPSSKCRESTSIRPRRLPSKSFPIQNRGGGVLIALSSRVRSYKRRYDLESCDECVWVEIPTSDGLNLIIGNHYFPPDTKPENIANYFRFL
jgi:hypothetical protein